MDKETILDYVMNTPENTNRMVLSDMLDELQTGSSSGGSSLITVTINKNGSNPSISADEVIEGLYNGLRYELIATDEYDTPIIFGELRLMQTSGSDNVTAFAIAPTSGAQGGDTRLSVALAGIAREWSDAANDDVYTWFVNVTAYYLDLGQYD